MNRFFSLRLFTIVAGLGYAYAVYVNYPLFRYYPLVGRYSWTDLADKSLGPAMSWYGWMLLAAIPAVVVAIIGKVALPESLLNKVTPPLLWITPVVMLYAGWVRENSWLMGPGG